MVRSRTLYLRYFSFCTVPVYFLRVSFSSTQFVTFRTLTENLSDYINTIDRRIEIF